MPSAPVLAFQAKLVTLLSGRFGPAYVTQEWVSLTGEDAVYSPRIDVAVGPFATGALQLRTSYNALFTRHHALIRAAHEAHRQNVIALRSDDRVQTVEAIGGRNPNARCFLAIEIENESSRKHILGGLLNASALGKIGIVAAGTTRAGRPAWSWVAPGSRWHGLQRSSAPFKG